MEKSKNQSSGSKRYILYSVIGLLVGINLLLFFYNRKIDNEKVTLQADRAQIEDARINLQDAFDKAVLDMNAFKGENSRMDSILIKNKKELQQQKLNIQQLLERNNLTSAELGQATALISNLKLISQNRVRQLDSLAITNRQLVANNIELKQNLETERAVTDQLVITTQILEEEKQAVTEEKIILQQEKVEDVEKIIELEEEKEELVKTQEKLVEKVTRAAVLQSANLEAFGVKFKRNGKEKETKDFKDVDKIKICYDILENPIADNGSQDLMVRIIHPEGFTLAVKELGSGKFTLAKSGEQRQYTTTAAIDYVNDEVQRYCTYWSYNSDLPPGVYQTELYHHGYQIGQTTFELKKTIF